MTPPTSAFLDALGASLRRPESHYLIPAVVSVILGHGTIWVPQIYKYSCATLPPAPATKSLSPADINDDPIPRRQVLRRIKEALVKSTILLGVPKVIETLLELNAIVEEGAQDDSFVRKEYEGLTGEEIIERGDVGLGRVYKDNIYSIWEKMPPAMLDIRFLTRFLTYGTLLSPIYPASPLTFIETEIVVLSTLVPQGTPREIRWHLRGALRSGMTRDEVEETHRAIERVCEECGVHGVGVGIARVQEISDEEI